MKTTTLKQALADLKAERDIHKVTQQVLNAAIDIACRERDEARAEVEQLKAQNKRDADYAAKAVRAGTEVLKRWCAATYRNPEAGWGGVGCQDVENHPGEHHYGTLRWSEGHK